MSFPIPFASRTSFAKVAMRSTLKRKVHDDALTAVADFRILFDVDNLSTRFCDITNKLK